MKLYIGILNGKIYDLRSKLISPRNDMIAEEDYLYLDTNVKLAIGDSWDSQSNVSLEDAPSRSIPDPMSRTELITKVEFLEGQLSRIDDLETETSDIKDRLTTVETKEP